MSKLDRVVNFYAAQFQDLGFEVVGDGHISYKTSTALKPVTVSGNRLTLPTKPILAAGDYSQLMVFHPLAEQFGTSLSPILNSLKIYVAMSIAQKLTKLLVAIAATASDAGSHKKLGGKLSKIIGSFGEMDKTTYKAVTSIATKLLDKPEHRIVNILMRNGGKEKALRSTIITFPIVNVLKEAFESDTRECVGVTLRKRDLEPIYRLFEYVTGGEAITSTSNDRTAPYYHSLLTGFSEICNNINEIINLFKAKSPMVASIELYELTWLEELGEGWDEFASSHHGVAPVMDDNRPVVEDVKVDSALEEKRNEVYNTTAIERPAKRSINDVVEDTRLVSGYDDRPARRDVEPSHSPRTSINDFGNNRSRSRGREEERPRGRSVYTDDRNQSSVRNGRRSIGIDEFGGGSSGGSRSRNSERRPSW